MPATPSPVPRRLLHRRAIDVQVFARDDGQFDVEARLVDTKTDDVPLGGQIRRAGEPIHGMILNVTVDRAMKITAASSQTLRMPYIGACDAHGNAYARLVGLNLGKGFRHAVNERLGGVRGCSHLTELCQVLPTAVLQAFANSVVDPTHARPDGGAPFQLDRCHALRSDGPTVAVHYPRWHRPGAVETAPSS
jgi:hypothetical protein